MRVLIISDIHSNVVALETVLAAAEGRYDTIWCLGDLVGYGPRPNESIALIRERASLCVMGNHDWAVLGRPGIDVDDFNPQARQAVMWTRAQLTAENRAFLEQIADETVVASVRPSILITHASPREPVWEYVLTASVALDNFPLFSESICFFGHTHKPVMYRWLVREAKAATLDDAQPAPALAVVECRQLLAEQRIQLTPSAGERYMINPGSVGQPRDNDPRAAYALLDLETLIFEYARVAYPIELTQTQMREANLPKRLIDRLSFGW
jgi:predicted phosphodiesterase